MAALALGTGFAASVSATTIAACAASFSEPATSAGSEGTGSARARLLGGSPANRLSRVACFLAIALRVVSRSSRAARPTHVTRRRTTRRAINTFSGGDGGMRIEELIIDGFKR